MAQTVQPSAPVSPSAPARSQTGPDWTVQAADTIDNVVTTIRDKSVVPLTTVARAIVYGLIAGVLGIAALVLVTALLVRFLDVYLPFHVGTSHARSVWITDALIGGIFSLAGLLLLRMARSNKANTAKR